MDTLDTERAQVRSRIARLRQAMQARGVAAVLVPSSDPHISEYLPKRWQGRQWLTGFTGSAGTAIVTAEFAGLWADSRYWGQAETQLAGTDIALMKTPNSASTSYIDWLAANVPAGQTVAVDGTVIGLGLARALESALTARGVKLRTDLDLLSEVWSDRPALPTKPVYAHTVAPLSASAKLGAVRAELAKLGASHHFISSVDDIAWLTNLRGSDVDYNPVFIAHLLIGPEQARLFIADGKIPPELRGQLAAAGIELAPYEQATAALGALPKDAALLMDPKRVTHGLRQAVAPGVRVIEGLNPSTLAKSRKTAAELAHIRTTMEHDGAALCEFFAWFEEALGRETITELTIDEHVTAARSRRPGFVSPSFGTIAASNANGAMPHYQATQASHATVCTPGKLTHGLLLIDSGGQYTTGTTDITRVVPVGETTIDQRRDYTLVLRGMINLSLAKFPRGTRSGMLDALAREPLWAAGLDYGHGTGHGIGYFLNVHEGPHGISPAMPNEPQTAMELGMITSNEPGLYRPGRWGIRIENLVVNVPAETTEFGEFLKFETLTLCPIDTRLVERDMMRPAELEWLNAYHAMVRERLTPHVTGAARDWLARRTAPL